MIRVIADRMVETEGRIDGDKVVVATDALLDILGWELKDEGLCRDDACIPTDRATIESPDGVDLVAAASAVGRPAKADPATGAVALGAPALDRSAALKDKVAPNFTLTDIDGESRSLADYAGKKRLLVAFSSW